MDNPSTTPTGSGPAPAPRPGTQDRAGRSDPAFGASRPGGGAADDAERLAKQGAEEIGREARDLKDSAKQGAADAAGKVRDAAGQAAQQAKHQAGQLAAQFREKGAALVDQQKSRAADLIGDCVAATRRAAQKLHDENDHNLAGYTDAIAEGLESTSRFLRERDARQLVDDAADLARRKPEWVLGGAFVVGLAVARFLKASRPGGAAYGSYRYDRPEEFGGGYGGGGYGGSYGGGYAGGYGGGVREYGSPLTSPSDAFGTARSDDPANFYGFAGNTPGAAGSAGTTGTGGTTGAGGLTTGTGSWTAAGAGENPSAGTFKPTGTTPSTNINPAQGDNPEVI